jgi:two-component system chemotaxis response regulator CheY
MSTQEQHAILVVDDQRTMRALVRQSLRELGHFEIIEAGDGMHALQLLTDRRIKLVISDFEMPRMDGLTLLRRIREHRDLGDIPFILLTSRSDARIVLEAKELGVGGYLVKPFTLGALQQRIETALKMWHL